MTQTTATAHTARVTPAPFDQDEFAAGCSCGWSADDAFTTRVAALGAFSRHIAAVIA